MEIKTIASFATYSTVERNELDAKIAVFKKALEITRSSVSTMVDSVESSARLPDHIGKNINTTA